MPIHAIRATVLPVGAKVGPVGSRVLAIGPQIRALGPDRLSIGFDSALVAGSLVRGELCFVGLDRGAVRLAICCISFEICAISLYVRLIALTIGGGRLRRRITGAA